MSKTTRRPTRPKNSVKRRPRSRGWQPFLEPLESRQLLATTVSWTSAISGSWDVASNWSTDTVPGPGDDVVINVPGVTVTISTNVESVNSITADDPLIISGGGLTVAANSTISGGLTMTGGLLTAKGQQVSFSVAGTTSISGANVYAEDGASLVLSQLTSYTGNTSTTTLEATGTGSTLTLANLATVTQDDQRLPGPRRNSRPWPAAR